MPENLLCFGDNAALAREPKACRFRGPRRAELVSLRALTFDLKVLEV